jgi:rhamnosyltransferase
VQVYVVIPTLNAAQDWEGFAPIVSRWISPDRVLIIDSSSDDGTDILAKTCGFRLVQISRSEFNHGATRQLAVDRFPDAELYVFLTQDAVLSSTESLDHLVRVFEDPRVAIAYGRQLPRLGATPIEAHARIFNYPETPSIRTLAARDELGFKAIFVSNSFAAYRRAALMDVGGFPSNVIMGEDTVTGAKVLLNGWQIAYVANAVVRHSHSYSLTQEFRRYFDIGVLHSRESWLVEEFQQANGEGARFVSSEVEYLGANSPWLIPSAFIRTVLKLIAYKLGWLERRLPLAAKRRMSMHKTFWSLPGQH